MIIKNKNKKICVFMFGGIGNYIMTTPLLSSIKTYLPSSHVTLLVAENFIAQASTGDNLIDQIINIKSYNIYALIKKLRNEKFDLTLTTSGTNPLKASFLAVLCGAKYRIGENTNNKGIFYNYKIPYDLKEHEVTANLKLLIPLNIIEKNPQLVFFINNKDMQYAKEIFIKNNFYKHKLTIAIHAGSGERLKFKRWRQDRFLLLSKKLVKKFNAKLIFLGGTNETDLVKNITQSLSKQDFLDYSGKLSIKESAALLKNCTLLISNDTCMIHIASALSLPLIALFGPTMSHKTGPFGDKHIILKSTHKCAPCYDYSYRECLINKTCMDDITVDHVLDAAEKLLTKIKISE